MGNYIIANLFCVSIALGAALVVLYLWMLNASIEKKLALRLATTEILCKYDDLSDASTEILSCISEQLGFVFAAIWLVDKNTKTVKCVETWQSTALAASDFRSKTIDLQFQSGVGLPGRVWSTGVLHWINDVQQDTNYPRAPYAKKCGLHSAVAFPMVCGDEVWGIVEFYRTKVQKPNSRVISLLSSLGSEMGQCIERWKSRELLEEEYILMRFVAEVTDCLTEINSIDVMLRKCTDLMVGHLGGAFARIWLVDSNGNNLVLRASSGIYTHLNGAHGRIEIGKYKIGKIAEKRMPHLTNDVLNDPEVSDQEWAKREGMVAFAGHPLVLDDQVIGVMALFSRNTLSERTIGALGGIANGIALGIKHRQERDAIADSERLFRQLTENIREAFFVLKPGPSVAYASPAYEELWGRSVAALQNDISELYAGIVEEHKESVKTLFEKSRDSESAAAGIEFRVNRPDGAMRWIWLRVFPTFDEAGNWDASYGIAHDISERKEAETRVNEFYSVVSHELRTPLTSIHASLRLMEGGLSGKLSDKTLNLVTIARSESDRLIRLINDMLDLKKLESGKLELKKKPVCTSQILQKAIKAMTPMAAAASVRLNAEIQWDGYLHCDEDRVLQVLENLLSNAIKFAPQQSTVLCVVEERSGVTRFSVTDMGSGIDPNQQSKLFSKFQQLNSTDSRPKGGTGLGLAICKAIVEEHKGKIGVDSRLGEGSTFWFELPCAYEMNDPNYLPIYRHQVLVLSENAGFKQELQTKIDTECFILHTSSTTEEASSILCNFKPAVAIIDNTLQHIPEQFLNELISNTHCIAILGENENRVSGRIDEKKLRQVLSRPLHSEELHAALCLSARQAKEVPITVLVAESQDTERELLKFQLSQLPIRIIEAKNGEEALSQAVKFLPDLIVLDIELPRVNGYQVIQVLRDSSLCRVPLLVYTCHELTKADKCRLVLGRSRHLTKSQTSDTQLLDTVKHLLNGLLSSDCQHKTMVSDTPLITPSLRQYLGQRESVEQN